MIPLVMIVVYLFLLLWVGRMGYVGHSRHTAADYYVAERSLGPFLLIMSIFGTTMTAFALAGSTGEAWQEGIGVYGLMASWSGIIHSACFFLIGIKLWHFGKRYGYTTQIQYFRDRFQSPATGAGAVPDPRRAGRALHRDRTSWRRARRSRASRRGAAGLVSADGRRRAAVLGAAVVCCVVLVYVFGGGVRSTAWANVAADLGLHVLRAGRADCHRLEAGRPGGGLAARGRDAAGSAWCAGQWPGTRPISATCTS